MNIAVDPSKTRQTIHSFGASDAWRCGFVGMNWPEDKRRAIADLLFSRKVDADGNPKGIGLSMWRFYLGAGNQEQGDASGIGDTWRRAECFLNPNGSYDWSKCKGQRWFLDAAKSRGVEYLLTFANAAPVQYSLNGKAYSDPGRNSMNIRADRMPDYARYLVDVVDHFHHTATKINYVSPVNEPQWGWESGSQEGTPASNVEMHAITQMVAEGLRDRKLASKVILGEAGDIEYLTGTKSGTSRSDQIRSFWEPSSPSFIGRLPNVEHALSGHSYWTTWPVASLISSRQKLSRRIADIDPKMAFWQSEFCVMEKNDDVGQGSGRDLGIDTALYVARVIHHDLVIANASHWSWWTALSESDYKDGLIYLDYEKSYTGSRSGNRAELQLNGKVLPSKILWAVGNYSRFVKPGMVRVELELDDGRSLLEQATSVMASAYMDKRSRQLVIVAINYTKEAVPFTVKTAVRGRKFSTYTTSATDDLRMNSVSSGSLALPARSVVTFVAQV
ncbi:MAG: glycoside hydrolase [Armatimonadota bacterium]